VPYHLATPQDVSLSIIQRAYYRYLTLDILLRIKAVVNDSSLNIYPTLQDLMTSLISMP
jgi:hypothetical protein